MYIHMYYHPVVVVVYTRSYIHSHTHTHTHTYFLYYHPVVVIYTRSYISDTHIRTYTYTHIHTHTYFLYYHPVVVIYTRSCIFVLTEVLLNLLQPINIWIIIHIILTSNILLQKQLYIVEEILVFACPICVCQILVHCFIYVLTLWH